MGGSGGGGGPFVKRSAKELATLVRKSEDKTTVAAFEAELGGVLADLLAAFNGRDAELVRERLEDVKEALEETIEGTIDCFFGGSVAKHTHVEGLSDIDSLVVIDGTGSEGNLPSTILRQMEKAIKRAVDPDVEVSRGRMAVTIDYPDGMSLQVLPAIRDAKGRLHVPSSREAGWSKINPETFREVLTKRNAECGGKLVPTIKLAKAINGQLPEGQRLSGYHIESLAIAAFRNYDGPKTTSAMLPTFFERSKELVRSPIRDSTGQSVHVDDYLGAADSVERLAMSHVLGRIEKRMRNATVAGSSVQWRALFGLEDE